MHLVKKKPYIKPELYVIEIEPLAMTATSMGINNTKGDYEDFAGKRRRGSWGDLWEEKE